MIGCSRSVPNYEVKGNHKFLRMVVNKALSPKSDRTARRETTFTKATPRGRVSHKSSSGATTKKLSIGESWLENIVQLRRRMRSTAEGNPQLVCKKTLGARTQVEDEV